ncbi:hypothetical protein KEM55_008845, partial [Ascosphaera atra]
PATKPRTSPSPTFHRGKRSLLKSLPSVRDHTTDQLDANKDEYICKEFDAAGETKVDTLGYLSDGRTYKCRTFTVPERGKKLFMLATETRASTRSSPTSPSATR